MAPKSHTFVAPAATHESDADVETEIEAAAAGGCSA